ncbi:hypothetical protein AGMMS49983_15970 [Clostridia bacterium]|nr:hypothetical protein AGMMS49983_15970 [Clostridia bacterium]
MKSTNLSKVKNRAFWAIAALIALYSSFLLCRYIFFALHGMKEYPFDLFLFGLVIIIIAVIFNWKKSMIFTVTGYLGGFAVGILFNTDGIGQGGGQTNNAWIIWTISFVVIVFIGIIIELASGRLKKKISDKASGR